jgi:Rrf2 family protein
MFRVNRQTDYAIRVLLALAQQPEGIRVSTAHIAEEMLIPKSFLPRIVAQLAQAGLIKTFPGRDGGLTLSRPASAITLKDVIETFEDLLAISECIHAEQACPFENKCPVRGRWARLQEMIFEELSTTTFDLLAQEAANA